MNVLFLAFEFPPLTAGGVQRPLKFAKYLPDFGIQPVVLTTNEESFRNCISKCSLDSSLLTQVPPNVVVQRFPCARRRGGNGKFSEWRRIFFSLVEDLAYLWWPALSAALPRLIEQYQPAALYVTVPPFCMGPLGCRIARDNKLPLILDFRDAWSQWRVSPYGSWLHYWLTRRLEGKCLRTADHVVCTSNQTRADFLRVHPAIPARKISVITNGYDENIEDWTPDFHPNANKFSIGYVGNFYYSPQARESMMRPWWRKRPNRMIQYAPRWEDWLYRSPYFFFQAVARLLEQHPDHRARLRIRFAGNKPDWIDAQVDEFGLRELVEFVGQLQHPSVLKFQRECDALLVTSSKVIGGQDYSIAGKTFEYLSMKKPILGFVAEGAQKELLAATGMAVLCDPDDANGSAARLNDLIRGGWQAVPNGTFLNCLHRRELARELAGVIRSVAVPEKN